MSDFQSFELYDLDEGAEARFSLHDLHKNIERFGFILGVEKRTFRDQDPVNIKAAELMGNLHDALKASGYVGHELEQLLTTPVFSSHGESSGHLLKKERTKTGVILGFGSASCSRS